jgi:large subunit ribosomal protein L6
MSRIGKKPIPVPAGVKIAIKDQTINVEGPKGKLAMTFKPSVRVAWSESEKSIACTIDAKDQDNAEVNALWGTTRALIRNMIEGVTKGYEKSLEVVGVGWQPTLLGKKLKLVVGFANPITLDIPAGLTVTLDEKNKQIVRIAGPDRQLVGQFASAVRSTRKPEPYNGKGVKYTEEVIKKKQGKQFGA